MCYKAPGQKRDSQDFKNANVIPIYERNGKKQGCGNRRGISLLETAANFIREIIFERPTLFSVYPTAVLKFCPMD